tara:strand:- start:253 stop:807 length:555 start_codon:yes stop_codon:yes gene_type:complete
MSLTITHAGNSVTPNTGPIRSGGQVIRVTPTLHAATSADNDVICLTTEIPNAVATLGGASKLTSLMFTCQQALNLNIDIILMQVETQYSASLGSGLNISDPNLVASKVLGVIMWDKAPITLNGNEVNQFAAPGASSDGAVTGQLPIMLQAADNSTSIYFTIIDRDGGDTFAADDLEFVFGIEYL